MASLLQSPILRAAAISGVMLPIGEVMCQLLREEAGGQPLSINWAAVARMSAIGTTLHGPFFFTGLRALDAVGRRHFPGRGPLASALLKAALGQLTLTPVYVASFFTYSGLLEGLSLERALDKAQAASPAAIRNGMVFWSVVHIVSFRFIPLSARIPYLGLAGMAWNTYLSFENATGGREQQPLPTWKVDGAAPRGEQQQQPQLQQHAVQQQQQQQPEPRQQGAPAHTRLPPPATQPVSMR